MSSESTIYKRPKDISNTIKQDLEDINIIQDNILDYLLDQNKTIDRIEDNLSKSNNNIHNATHNLHSANTYYYGWTPIIAGGLLGCIMVTPVIGLLGIKYAPAISFTGSMLGSISGYKIQLL